MKKPVNFQDLLECQEYLQTAIYNTRENGYVPRQQTLLDIFLALDDELQEWCKELPSEYNFKSWKQKQYNEEEELKEFIDILFFLLRIAMDSEEEVKEDLGKLFDTFEGGEEVDLSELIVKLKIALWSNNLMEFLKTYLSIAKVRGFRGKLLDAYYDKWLYNLTRINKKGDWVD